jgi:hypothetical protein
MHSEPIERLEAGRSTSSGKKVRGAIRLPKVEDLRDGELEAAVKLMKHRQLCGEPVYDRNPNLANSGDTEGSLVHRRNTST